MFAATGQIPDRQSSNGPRLNDRFVSLPHGSGSVDGLSWKPESQIVVVAPENVRQEHNPLAAGPVDRPTMRKSRFLIAAANSTFGNKKYIVEVGTSKQPIKAVSRETTETERVSNISRNLATSSREDAGGSRTARLRFYFTRLVANRADHLCFLTKQLGVDLVLQARDRQDKQYSARW
jgi:hypothetical protein